jgi:membrane protein YdbS with pleckstrin-like domain
MFTDIVSLIVIILNVVIVFGVAVIVKSIIDWKEWFKMNNYVFKMYDSWFILLNKLIPYLIIFFIVIINFQFSYILIPFFIVSFLFFILYRYYYRYYFYEDFVEVKIGFLNIQSYRLSYNKISSVNTNQNIIFKLFNIGTIQLSDFSKQNIIKLRLITDFNRINELFTYKNNF